MFLSFADCIRSVRWPLLLWTAGASALLSGCYSSFRPPPPPTPLAPSGFGGGPTHEDQRFGIAVDTYLASVKLLEHLPLAADYRATRRTLAALAHAVENIPDIPRATAQMAADLMRNDWSMPNLIFLGSEPNPTQLAKQTLQYAASAFSVAAETRYANNSVYKEELSSLLRSIVALDEAQPLSDQHNQYMEALERAGRVLTLMQAGQGADRPVEVPAPAASGPSE